MSCTHPLKGFNIGINPKTHNNLLKITSYKADHVEKCDDGKIRAFFDSNTHNVFGKRFDEWQEIPCGQCINCRLEYSRQWANRCALEMKYHDSNLFLTLTYDDEHLPTRVIKDFVDPLNGEVKDLTVHSLVKEDMQKFMKSLRDAYGYEKLRFFGCGEYGSVSCRPHLHIIIFGLKLDDLKVYKTIKQGDEYITYYNSKFIDKIWKKGFTVIAPATWETVAYTARYVTKKLNGDMADFYKWYGIEPEFVLMSRKPGIGYKYFEDNMQHIFDTNNIVISNLKGSRQIKPPRYFKKALEKIDPDWYNDIREYNKEQAEIVKNIKLSKTSLSYLDYLDNEEKLLKEKIKVLKRNKV